MIIGSLIVAFFEWLIWCCFACIKIIPLTLVEFRCLFFLSPVRSQVNHAACYLRFIIVIYFYKVLAILIEIEYVILYFLSVIPHSNSFIIFINYFAITMLKSIFPVSNVDFPVFPLVFALAIELIIFKHAFINLTFPPN